MKKAGFFFGGDQMCEVDFESTHSLGLAESMFSPSWYENRGVEITSFRIRRLHTLGMRMDNYRGMTEEACCYILKAIDFLGMGVERNSDLYDFVDLIFEDSVDFYLSNKQVDLLKKVDYRLPYSGLLEYVIQKDLDVKTLWEGLKTLKEGTVLKGTPEEIIFQILWS